MSMRWRWMLFLLIAPLAFLLVGAAMGWFIEGLPWCRGC